MPSLRIVSCCARVFCCEEVSVREWIVEGSNCASSVRWTDFCDDYYQMEIRLVVGTGRSDRVRLTNSPRAVPLGLLLATSVPNKRKNTAVVPT